MTMRNGLDPVLRPRGVAIVGASQDPTKRGHQVVRALTESSYQGGIYPVNPRGGRLYGLPVATSVEEIEGDPDLALICTPASSTPAVIEACARKGIRGAIILAVGFGESGEEGKALEARVLRLARHAGIRVVGPNTSGLLNLGIDLNLIGFNGLRRGNLALLVQSGNTALSLLSRAAAWGGGVSICVGVGNEADIGFDEYLDYLEDDADTSAILMYVDGFRDGRKFLETASRVTRSKPIVLLKGGRSEVGSAAARSHTGAVAGEYRTFQAALRQAGVIEAERSDELLAIAETLAGQPAVSAGKGIAVLADGGGQAVVAVDTLVKHDVPLARLASTTRSRLRALLGPAAAVGNPIDVAGAGDRQPRIFAEALQILADDDAVGGILMIGLFGGYAIRFAAELDSEETAAAEQMSETIRNSRKPLVLHSIYAGTRTEPLRRLYQNGVPVIESVEVACAAIAAASKRGRVLAAASSFADLDSGRPAGAGLAVPGDAYNQAVREGRDVLLEPEARALVAAYDVPVPPAVFCDSPRSVQSAVARFGCPVALKVVSPSLPHKSDGGGVALDVQSPEAAASRYERMVRDVAAHLTAQGIEPDIRGVLVSPMLDEPIAELLMGVRRDPSFGPVLTFGAGGTAVELLQDISLRVLPIERGDALAMQEEVRIGKVLRGFRGAAPVDAERIADLLLGLAQCALEHPEFEEIEINPVFAYANGLTAVDVRAYLRAPIPAAAPAAVSV